MTQPLDTFIEQLQAATTETGKRINDFLDASFPERVVQREEAARLGYQGRRNGWYPHKPRRP